MRSGESMLKKLMLLFVVSISLSGCFMAPLALIGPASSGFTTASIVQSGATTGANFLIKKSTGKSITEHAMDSFLEKDIKRTYMPVSEKKPHLIKKK